MEMTTIEQIHFDFDNASNDIKTFTTKFRKEEFIGNEEHANILATIGFNNNPIVIKSKKLELDNKQREKDYNKNKELSTNVNYVIDYYKQHFPFNKFIFLPQVLNICEKYNLKIGQVSLFKGDVPEKNINDIGRFLKQEKILKEKYNQNINVSVNDTNIPLSSMIIYEGKSNTLDQYYICAPLKDFYINKSVNMIGVELYKDNKKPTFKYIRPEKIVIPDPIVLKPVYTKNLKVMGFLILTAWGDEAADSNVVNENFN